MSKTFRRERSWSAVSEHKSAGKNRKLKKSDRQDRRQVERAVRENQKEVAWR